MFQLLECHDAVLRGQRLSSVSKGAFAEIGRQAAGAAGYVIVDSCLVASQFLFCVSYPIFIATNTRAVLESLLPLPPSVTFLTLVQLPVLVPYCWASRQ
jgi:amino acid permease